MNINKSTTYSNSNIPIQQNLNDNPNNLKVTNATKGVFESITSNIQAARAPTSQTNVFQKWAGSITQSNKAPSEAAIQIPILTEGPSRLERAQEVAAEINQKADPKYSTIISPFIREPLINLSKQENLTVPEEKFARLIPYERFLSSLRTSFTSTQSDIISASTAYPAYIIIADREDKSTNWTVSQTFTLKKPNTDESKTFTYEKGELILQK